MARSMNGAPDAKVYRAVVTLRYPGQEPYESYEGPYDSSGAAARRVSFWTNRVPGSTGHVETGQVTWKRTAS